MSRSILRLIAAWAALMLLLGLTLGASFLPLGPAKPLLAYAIATAKAALVLWFFMEMRGETSLARFAAAAGFLWLFFLLLLSGSDYLTRG